MPAPSDLRRAFRSLARRRTFAVIAVLTLTLAFSIPAVVLSTVDRHFWRPLDLPGSDRLFTLQIWVEDGYFSPLSHPEYLQLREVGAEAEAFSLAAFGILDFTMVAGGAPTRVDVALVSGDFFTLLGAAPAHGRLLALRDDDPGGAPAVAVVSRRAWTTHFGRDPNLVGRTVRLGSQVFNGRRRRGQPASRPGARPGLLGAAVGSRPAPAQQRRRTRSLRGLAGHGRAARRIDSRAATPRCWRRWPGIGYRPDSCGNTR